MVWRFLAQPGKVACFRFFDAPITTLTDIGLMSHRFESSCCAATPLEKDRDSINVTQNDGLSCVMVAAS